jgi:3-hydroxyisobutyrate dehydrogenase-like beta-hydroxyacid dehydrogenase
MNKAAVGILHPGEMGISIAASILQRGHTVYWASAGRAAATQARAQAHGLVDAGDLEQLCAQCELIVSVCPPHAAEEVAQQVAAAGFAGLYIDANAIAPARARRIGQIVAQAGAQCVDGGIIGPPAWQPGKSWLYLSGPAAPAAAEYFGAPLQVSLLGDAPDAASALKMSYAAYTKGTTALLSAILAAAETLGVRDSLMHQWELDGNGLAEKAPNQVRTVTAKAWRFSGEMEEIAATLEAAGVPGGFHLAAAELYRRIAHFKDAPSTPELDEVLAALVSSPTKAHPPHG